MIDALEDGSHDVVLAYDSLRYGIQLCDESGSERWSEYAGQAVPYCLMPSSE